MYTRVSTDEQAQKGYSLSAQLRVCSQRAYELGALIVLHFADEGFSGGTLARPGLTAARDLVRQGGVGLFVCLDPDRLARNLTHQLILTEELESSGVRLDFINFEWKNTAEGRLFYSLRGAIAEYEREKIKERTRLGRFEKARRGILTHNPGTFGYTFDSEHDCLIVHPGEEPVVRLIFDLFTVHFLGYQQIADRLNSRNIASPRQKAWTRSTVRRIVRNETYTGTLYVHRFQVSGTSGQRRSERPAEEWQPIKVPPLVTQETWSKAQLLAARQRPGPRASRSGNCGCASIRRHNTPESRVSRNRKEAHRAPLFISGYFSYRFREDYLV